MIEHIDLFENDGRCYAITYIDPTDRTLLCLDAADDEATDEQLANETGEPQG